MKKIFYMIMCGGLLLNFSCKSKENINYMKNIEDVAIQASNNVDKATIQPGDNLQIKVSAQDMEVVAPFNQVVANSETTQYSVSNTNLPQQTQSSSSGPIYTVSSQNEIVFPVVGTISTKSMTIEELSMRLKNEISRFVKNPAVSIKNTNFKVTVLGEVEKPGYYLFPDGQTATVFSALGLAGDLTIYGRRDDVLLVRKVDGETTKQYINLSDANFINSEFYSLKQNDVIYVSANKTRQNASVFGPQTTIWISVASVAVGLLALFVNKF